MSKQIIFVLGFLALLFSGCASTRVVGLKENWIDDEDLRMAMNTKSVRELTAKFGLPVFTELHGDTVELVYNCRPHLYNSVRDGIEYKPNEFDRVGQWSTRVEMVGLLTVGDSLVGIRHRNDYEGDKTRSVREEKSVGITATIIGAVLGVAALVTTVILVAD